VRTFADQLDAVFIITPHVLHFAQATACLEAGIDVLLEKPMVMSANEATALIRTRDRSGRLLVVAFQGSLSPQIREASRRLRSGELGAILNISAVAWQNWATLTDGTWRQSPELSGGGFLFDTGAPHAQHHRRPCRRGLRPGCCLARERRSAGRRPGRRDGPAAVRRARNDECLRERHSVMPLGHPGVHHEGHPAYRDLGETLELQRAGAGRLTKVRSVVGMPVWDQFLNVRAGRHVNPSPPEVGLRMARLWDAIRESAANGGAVSTSPLGATLEAVG